MSEQTEGGERRLDIGPDELLTHLMAQLGHLLERHVDQAVGPVGLTLRQLVVLAHLQRRPGLNRRDLARALLTTPQAVSLLVSRMIAAELIERQPCRGGRQPQVLTPTHAGLQALQHAAPRAAAAEAAALEHLDPAEVTATYAALRRLLNHLADDKLDPAGTVPTADASQGSAGPMLVAGDSHPDRAPPAT